ncbi:MAG: hypothetical protein RLY31_1590 [Bacteroidota bacterium]|jgi:hypothetical protein
MKLFLFALASCCLPSLLLLPGCTAPPDPILTFRDRELVDSLFRRQADTLAPRFDSLCKAQMDSLVQLAVDSILLERNKEIELYRQRLRLDSLH